MVTVAAASKRLVGPRSWRGAGGTPKRGRMMDARVPPLGSECDSLSSPGVSAGGEVS